MGSTDSSPASSNDSVNIRIKEETWQRLHELKNRPGKTWDDVITDLLDETENETDTPAESSSSAD